MSLLDDYLTYDQLAAELGVSPRTVIRYTRQPDGLPYTTIGGRTLFRRQSVLDWIASHERRPNPRRAA